MNPADSFYAPPGSLAPAPTGDKLLLVLVGLPARGKSFMANKLTAFLRWRGVAAENFNVGAARRQAETAARETSSAGFFAADNAAAKALREKLAMDVLHSALDWLSQRGPGSVAILDATNTTRERRRHLLEAVAQWTADKARQAQLELQAQQAQAVADSHRKGGGSNNSLKKLRRQLAKAHRHRQGNNYYYYPGDDEGSQQQQHAGPSLPYVIFLEMVCTDASVLRSNMLQKVTNSPDYRSMPVEVALADLTKRIAEYEKVYQTLDEGVEDATSPLGPISYIKLTDLQSKVVCRRIFGHTAYTIVSFLMVIHIGQRPIWLVRAGQCTDDVVRAMIQFSMDGQDAGSSAGSSARATPALLHDRGDGAGALAGANGASDVPAVTVNGLHFQSSQPAAPTAASAANRAPPSTATAAPDRRSTSLSALTAAVDSHAATSSSGKGYVPSAPERVKSPLGLAPVLAVSQKFSDQSPWPAEAANSSAALTAPAAYGTLAHRKGPSSMAVGDAARSASATPFASGGASTIVSSITAGAVTGTPGPAGVLHMYKGLASLSSSMATTALSAGLTLNESGRSFARMLAGFVLRRTAGGVLRLPRHSRHHHHHRHHHHQQHQQHENQIVDSKHSGSGGRRRRRSLPDRHHLQQLEDGAAVHAALPSEAAAAGSAGSSDGQEGGEARYHGASGYLGSGSDASSASPSHTASAAPLPLSAPGAASALASVVAATAAAAEGLQQSPPVTPTTTFTITVPAGLAAGLPTSPALPSGPSTAPIAQPGVGSGAIVGSTTGASSSTTSSKLRILATRKALSTIASGGTPAAATASSSSSSSGRPLHFVSHQPSATAATPSPADDGDASARWGSPAATDVEETADESDSDALAGESDTDVSTSLENTPVATATVRAASFSTSAAGLGSARHASNTNTSLEPRLRFLQDARAASSASASVPPPGVAIATGDTPAPVVAASAGFVLAPAETNGFRVSGVATDEASGSSGFQTGLSGDTFVSGALRISTSAPAPALPDTASSAAQPAASGIETAAAQFELITPAPRMQLALTPVVTPPSVSLADLGTTGKHQQPTASATREDLHSPSASSSAVPSRLTMPPSLSASALDSTSDRQSQAAFGSTAANCSSAEAGGTTSGVASASHGSHLYRQGSVRGAGLDLPSSAVAASASRSISASHLMHSASGRHSSVGSINTSATVGGLHSATSFSSRLGHGSSTGSGLGSASSHARSVTHVSASDVVRPVRIAVDDTVTSSAGGGSAGFSAGGKGTPVAAVASAKASTPACSAGSGADQTAAAAPVPAFSPPRPQPPAATAAAETTTPTKPQTAISCTSAVSASASSASPGATASPVPIAGAATFRSLELAEPVVPSLPATRYPGSPGSGTGVTAGPGFFKKRIRRRRATVTGQLASHLRSVYNADEINHLADNGSVEPGHLPRSNSTGGAFPPTSAAAPSAVPGCGAAGSGNSSRSRRRSGRKSLDFSDAAVGGISPNASTATSSATDLGLDVDAPPPAAVAAAVLGLPQPSSSSSAAAGGGLASASAGGRFYRESSGHDDAATGSYHSYSSGSSSGGGSSDDDDDSEYGDDSEDGHMPIVRRASLHSDGNCTEDEEEEAGILVSAPKIAQNDHYAKMIAKKAAIEAASAAAVKNASAAATLASEITSVDNSAAQLVYAGVPSSLAAGAVEINTKHAETVHASNSNNISSSPVTTDHSALPPTAASNSNSDVSGTGASTAAQQAGACAADGEGQVSPSIDMELLVYDAPPAIFTSTLPRTIETVAALPFPSQQLSALNPMETGICLGVPLQYLPQQFPDEYQRWANSSDKASHRITGGESLMDVVQRLTPFVIEMERCRRPVLVCSHLSTLQVLLAYFKGVPLQDCVTLDFPMNAVIEFTPHQYGWLERRYSFTRAAGDDTITSSSAAAGTGAAASAAAVPPAAGALAGLGGAPQ